MESKSRPAAVFFLLLASWSLLGTGPTVLRGDTPPEFVSHRAPGPRSSPPRPSVQHEDHGRYTLWGAFYDLRGRWQSRLTLNNKGADAMRPRVRLFSHDGRAVTVPDVVVAANSFLDIDLAPIAAQAGEGFEFGSISVTYYGHELEMGAQVVIADLAQRLQFDEQLSYASAASSNRREAVWWLPSPGASLSVALANVTDAPVTVRGHLRGARAVTGGPERVDVVLLRPHEVRVIKVEPPSGGGRTATVGGAWIEYDGPPGAVLARGFAEDARSGYSAPVPFEAPAALKSSTYHGAGVRLDPVAGSELRPVIVARNVGATPATVTGRLVVATTDGQMATFVAPTLALGPNETGALDFQQAWSEARGLANRRSAGLEFEYSTGPGSIIMSASSVSADGNHVFRVPLIDPLTVASSTGGYMWRADGTTLTTVYVKNVTGTPQRYLLQLSYDGGAYAPGLKTLQPGETATVDLRSLRDDQTPDAWGRTIPATVTSGQVHWSAKGRERFAMIGRAEHTDVAHGVSASYSCINCCPDNPYGSWTINDPIVTGVGEWVDVFLTLQDIDCYQTVLEPYAVNWYSLNWYIADTGIATGSNNATVTGVNGGTTALYATYDAEWWYKDAWEGGWFCNSEPYPVNFATPVEVQACPVTPVGAHDPDPYPLDTANLTAGTQTALSCLQSAVQTAGGTLTLQSAYRPQSYQTHLREVWDKWQAIKDRTDAACAQTKDQVRTEWDRHNLAYQPAVTSNHSGGTAFDANWSPQSLNIGQLAAGCNLSRPVAGDPIHFVYSGS